MMNSCLTLAGEVGYDLAVGRGQLVVSWAASAFGQAGQRMGPSDPAEAKIASGSRPAVGEAPWVTSLESVTGGVSEVREGLMLGIVYRWHSRRSR